MWQLFIISSLWWLVVENTGGRNWTNTAICRVQYNCMKTVSFHLLLEFLIWLMHWWPYWCMWNMSFKTVLYFSSDYDALLTFLSFAHTLLSVLMSYGLMVLCFRVTLFLWKKRTCEIKFHYNVMLCVRTCCTIVEASIPKLGLRRWVGEWMWKFWKMYQKKLL